MAPSVIFLLPEHYSYLSIKLSEHIGYISVHPLVPTCSDKWLHTVCGMIYISNNCVSHYIYVHKPRLISTDDIVHCMLEGKILWTVDATSCSSLRDSSILGASWSVVHLRYLPILGVCYLLQIRPLSKMEPVQKVLGRSKASLYLLPNKTSTTFPGFLINKMYSWFRPHRQGGSRGFTQNSLLASKTFSTPPSYTF